MQQNIITTNIRVEKTNWHQVRVIAAERGVSVNKYINDLIKTVTTRNMLGIYGKTIKKKSTIWDLPKLAKLSTTEKFTLAQEDEIIYG